MSAKKEAKAKAPTTAAVKKAKVDPATKIKRNADGTKAMKVARGTERARRRAGLKKGWKQHPNVAQMLPTRAEEAAKAAA